MATGLAIDTSDMDIAVVGIQAESRTKALEQIHNRLDGRDAIVSNHLISTASVPVVKLEINYEKLCLTHTDLAVPTIKSLKIDLTFGDEGVTITKRCSDFVKQKMHENPVLKPLAQVLKKYLQLKNLNSPFQGTVSSYGLVMMILALLNDLQKVNPYL